MGVTKDTPISPAQAAHRERSAIIREIAGQFVDRATTMRLRGKRRDDAAIEFFVGAAALAKASGDELLHQHIGRIIGLSITIRGYEAVVSLTLRETA